MKNNWAIGAAIAATAIAPSAQAGRYLIVDIVATGTGNGVSGSRTASRPNIYYGFTDFSASFAYHLDGMYAPWAINGGLGFVGQMFDLRSSGLSTANGFEVKADLSSHFVNYRIAGNACYANNTPGVVATGSFASDPSCGKISVDYGDGFAVSGYSFAGTVNRISFREVEAMSLPDLTFAIPEPATWALMLAGFSLTGYTLRRRRARLAPTARS